MAKKAAPPRCQPFRPFQLFLKDGFHLAIPDGYKLFAPNQIGSSDRVHAAHKTEFTVGNKGLPLRSHLFFCLPARHRRK